MMQSSTELKCFKGLVYFYVVLLSVSVVLSPFGDIDTGGTGPITEPRASRRSGLVLGVKLRVSRERKSDTTMSVYILTK